MNVKEELHHLIEELDESNAYEILDYGRWLKKSHDELTAAEWELLNNY